MRSMTGFGRGSTELGVGRVTAEVRSVNHKYLDLRISLPPDLASIEEEVERRLRARFRRGRVEATLRLQGSAGTTLSLDRELARSCLLSLEQLRGELGLTEPVSVSVLAAVPSVFQLVSLSADEDPGLRAAALEALESAAAAAERMRDLEGAALGRDLESRLSAVEALLVPMRTMADEVAPAVLERLRARLSRLLEGLPHSVDEVRLAQEAAMIADRADVNEELTRLESHVAQFRSIAAEDGAMGRRLEFLLQEMSREASTVGAKAQEARLQHLVVDLRGELARMREQVHNVE